ncbi:MAG: hypothetical protein H6810_02720 [Phycisphaeraceae bacterium]|nr:MAG: hypothetical protein H6810_02720 [Phycisphaeraceae bacterium]
MANGTHPNIVKPGIAAAPIGSVLAFTFFNSLGTGAVQIGIFFLLQSAFAYGRRDNYTFGLVLYGAYVGGALAAGPLLRRLTELLPGLSTRAVLLASLVCQAAGSLTPQAVAWATGADAPPEWTIWIVAIGYGVFTGVMWPIVESYLSGGRKGHTLSAATGRFNVVWSGAVLVAVWLMAPLLETNPLGVITALGVVQLASAGLLARFGPEPGRHLPHEHEPHPGSWRHLLTVFRVLLPLAYVVSGTLAPLLPTTLESIGVREAWRPPVASAWLVTRVIVFFLFERWPGWHGRRWMPVVAGGCLVAGFAGTVIAPWLGGSGLLVLIAMLGLFGMGHAMIYLGALYYAMEVGRAEVDAGGTHEALIGLGYALGPAIGLGVLLVPGGGSEAAFESRLIAVVAVFALAAAGIVAHRLRTLPDRPGSSSE